MFVIDGALHDVGYRVTIKSSGKFGIITEISYHKFNGPIDKIKGKLGDGELFECEPSDAVVEVIARVCSVLAIIIGTV